MAHIKLWLGFSMGEENRMLKAQFAELDCDVVQRIGRLNAGSKVASEMWQAVWMTVGSKDRRVCGGSPE